MTRPMHSVNYELEYEAVVALLWVAVDARRPTLLKVVVLKSYGFVVIYYSNAY